jgi:regulator of sigma E protease
MSFLWEGALPFILVLGTVVVFHEFGHFLAAKAFGITVEVFSVGFGPRIAGFTFRGTEYRVAWIPLGGYVKLKGEIAPEDGHTPEPGELMAHPRWQRFIVFVMGAVFNIITAVSLTTVIFMIGEQEPTYLQEPPVVGSVAENSPATQADIRPGDLIVSFGGQDVLTWDDLTMEIMLSPQQTKEVVLQREGKRLSTLLRVDADPRNANGVASVYPATDGVVAQEVHSGTPADEAGLEAGDLLVAVDGTVITSSSQLVPIIRAATGQPMHFTVKRGEESLELTIVPEDVGGVGQAGVNLVEIVPTVTRSYPFVTAVRLSVLRNLEWLNTIYKSLALASTGQLSLRAFSGPIEIVRFSGQAAQRGGTTFLKWIAIISLNLGVINLLPIPPLDGGHLLFITIEGVSRRELSLQLKERMMQAGLILLFLFMGAILYFDISKNWFN